MPPQAMLDVPMYPQEKYHCGPAALAGLFEYRGSTVTPQDIADRVFIPDRKGSLQIEMTAAIRQSAFLAYELEQSFDDLLREVSNGNPVLVLQNLGLSWWPKWHYANVVGYDLDARIVVLNSGRIANYEIGVQNFLNTWARAGYWAIVAMPPTQIPATARPQKFVGAAADLERVGQVDAAADAYEAALARWPNNVLALMGKGNVAFGRADFAAAAEAFAAVAQADPDNAFAWNNLAYALLETGCTSAASSSIARAAANAPDDERISDSVREIESAVKQAGGGQECADYEALIRSAEALQQRSSG